MDRQEALAKLQATELEILVAFSNYCRKHNILWFMDSGTVLGAKRHGGFIPWDDDIDVGMLRADYDRFIRLSQSGFIEGYSVHTPDNTEGFAGMFAKIYKDGTSFDTEETLHAGLKQGIFIDIFPYDYLPADQKADHRLRRGARFWQSVSYLYHSPVIVVPHKGFVGRLERFACRLAHRVVRRASNPKRITEKYMSAISFGGERSDLLLPLAWPNIEGVPETVLVPTSVLEFEGVRLPAPAQPERYLELMYGDWETLPAPEDRRTHLPVRLVFGDGTYWSNS